MITNPKNITTMTHTTMTSILNQHPVRTSSRTSAKSNNYWVEVVDTDNESHGFAVEARNEDEANRRAAQMANNAGVYDINYVLIYKEI